MYSWLCADVSFKAWHSPLGWGCQQLQHCVGTVVSVASPEHLPRGKCCLHSPGGLIFSPAASRKPNFLQQRCSSPSSLWLVVSLVSIRTPRSFLVELLSSLVATDMYWCFSLGAGICTSLWQTSQGSCEPNSPAWCPSGWQHNPLICQPLLPVLCDLQTSAGNTVPIIQIINEEAEQGGTQHWPLEYTPVTQPNWTSCCWTGSASFQSTVCSCSPHISCVSGRILRDTVTVSTALLSSTRLSSLPGQLPTGKENWQWTASLSKLKLYEGKTELAVGICLASKLLRFTVP